MGQIAFLFLISGPSHPVISHRERKPQHSSECKTQHFAAGDPPNSDCCSRQAESSRSQSKLINEIHRIRPEHLCRPNILPCQVFDNQKLSFQLSFVFDELCCQPCAKPDQSEHHGAGFGRELALFGVALQQTMRMGQDAMGGCVAHQSNKICELMIHGTSKCPQVLVPAIFGLLQPTSQRKRTIRAGLRAQCLLAPQPATWTQPLVSASAARPTSLAYPVTSVRQACSTAQASPATSRHNGKPKKLQCIRFRLEKPNSQLVALQKNKTFGGSLVCKSGSFSMPRKVIVFYDDIQTMTTHFCGLGMRAGSC